MRADRKLLSGAALAAAGLTVLPVAHASAATAPVTTVTSSGSGSTSTSSSTIGGFATFLPDLNGDGVPEVQLSGGSATTVRDGRTGRVVLTVAGAQELVPARVGPRRSMGLEVVEASFGSAGRTMVVAAYTGDGHRVWRHALPALTGPAGADSSTGSTTQAIASIDAPGSTDLVVEETLTADDDDGRHRLLRVTVVDAATGAVRRLVDQRDGGVAASLVPLGGNRDGLVVDHRISDTAGTLSGIDGTGRQLWVHQLDGAVLVGAAPLTSAAPGATPVSPLGLFGESLGSGAVGGTAQVLIGTAKVNRTGTTSTVTDAHTELVDTVTGTALWDRPAQLAGTLSGGHGKGAAAIVSTQQGRTLTVTAVERNGATRWKHAIHVASAGMTFAFVVDLGNVAGSPVPDLGVGVLGLGSGSSQELVLDGATGATLPTPDLGLGGGSTTPGVVDGGAFAPGGHIALLHAATGVGGTTTVSRRDVGAHHDRWRTTVGGAGSIAREVDGAAGPRGCGSVDVALGSANAATSIAVLGLTNGDVRWTIDLTTGRTTPGAHSAKAC